MEEPIGKLCNAVGKFCNHLETSCSALKESVERRAIPLDSASTTFVQSVNRRVSTASADLNMLESMSFATVSFEELLGHCNEVLKKNQNDLAALQDFLGFSDSTYIRSLDFDEEEEDVEQESVMDTFNLRDSDTEDDPLLDDSLSLKNFGISDVSIKTIAAHADDNFEVDEPDFLPCIKSFKVKEGEKEGELKHEDFNRLLNVTSEDYESLPKHIKGLASFEHLLVAVEKMNTFIGTKRISTLSQDEIELLGLGFKIRSYILLLIKMDKLCVETSEGGIHYRIL